MLGRADQGGLASQTLEMARHCHPARVLLIDLGARGRGTFDPVLYGDVGADVRIVTGPPSPEELRWLVKGMDAVYTAEANYNDDLPLIAARYGVRHVVHCNPELWRADCGGPTTELVAPTSWEVERIGSPPVMPMPVDRQRLPFRRRASGRRFLFPAAPAFHDRHGQQQVYEAFRRLRRANVSLLVGPKPVSPRGRVRRFDGGATLEHVPPRWHYFDYPDADVLVLPRRYGGLSLPMQEAASLGMAIITLDLPPYAHDLVPELLVAPRQARTVAMKGGEFSVWTCWPTDLVAAVERAVDDDDLVARASLESDCLAEQLSWDRWEEPWRAFLQA